MIQEIHPSVYVNAYEPGAVPKAGDAAVYVREGKVCLMKDGDALAFPRLSGGEEGRFLFRIDGRGWYLLSGDGPEKGTWYSRRDLRGACPKVVSFAGLCALQLAGWYEANRFCGRCGTPLSHDAKERMMRCPDCGNMFFPKICPAVIVGVTKGDKLLVTKYKDRPSVKWALVAGFAEIGETIEDTVRREVLEETGVRVKNLRFYKSQPWCMSDSLLIGFWCEAEEDAEPIPDGTELSVAMWIRRDEIDLEPDDVSLTNEMICRFKAGKERE